MHVMSDEFDRFLAWRRSRGLPATRTEVAAPFKEIKNTKPPPKPHGNLGQKRRPRTAEEKAHLAVAVSAGHTRKRYVPPAEFQEMYKEFLHKFGRKEADRLVRDHIAVVSRGERRFSND